MKRHQLLVLSVDVPSVFIWTLLYDYDNNASVIIRMIWSTAKKNIINWSIMNYKWTKKVNWIITITYLYDKQKRAIIVGRFRDWLSSLQGKFVPDMALIGITPSARAVERANVGHVRNAALSLSSYRRAKSSRSLPSASQAHHQRSFRSTLFRSPLPCQHNIYAQASIKLMRKQFFHRYIQSSQIFCPL